MGQKGKWDDAFLFFCIKKMSDFLCERMCCCRGGAKVVEANYHGGGKGGAGRSLGTTGGLMTKDWRQHKFIFAVSQGCISRDPMGKG